MTESIDTMTYELTQTAIKLGVSKSVALDLAKALLEQIKKHAGGGCIYVRKPSKDQRNDEIRKMFNGVNCQEVCDAFKISRSTMYRIVGENKKRDLY